MTDPAATAVSPVDAARAAFDHTRRQLLPFRLEKWLVLGFLAFLDQCGRSGTWGPPGGGGDGGGEGIPHPGGKGAADLAAALDTGLAWLSEHLAAVILGGLVLLVIVVAVMAAVVWLNARGTFMYLDAVVTGRAEVRRPWREHAARADSYFGWSLGISLAGLAVVGIGVALLGAVAVALAQGRLTPATTGLVMVALLPVLLLLVLALPLLLLAGVALRDFVAPLQLATGLPCGEAARVLEGLLLAHPGSFVVYLLLKLVLTVATGVVVVLGGCLTCCIGFLPVVLQTLFQPLFFFERAFPVFLLRQMGHPVDPSLGR